MPISPKPMMNVLRTVAPPKGAAGGDLTGSYPEPTIKSSVKLPGSPTVGTTPGTTDNSTKIASTAYVQSNLSSYVKTSDSRLTDSRTPKGTAGGDLAGTYPNPSIKDSVTLTGSPTAPTPDTTDNSTQIATTAYVKNNLIHGVRVIAAGTCSRPNSGTTWKVDDRLGGSYMYFTVATAETNRCSIEFGLTGLQNKIVIAYGLNSSAEVIRQESSSIVIDCNSYSSSAPNKFRFCILELI